MHRTLWSDITDCEDVLVAFVIENGGCIMTSQLSDLYDSHPWLKPIIGSLAQFCRESEHLEYSPRTRAQSATVSLCGHTSHSNCTCIDVWNFWEPSIKGNAYGMSQRNMRVARWLRSGTRDGPDAPQKPALRTRDEYTSTWAQLMAQYTAFSRPAPRWRSETLRNGDQQTCLQELVGPASLYQVRNDAGDSHVPVRQASVIEGGLGSPSQWDQEEALTQSKNYEEQRKVRGWLPGGMHSDVFLGADDADGADASDLEDLLAGYTADAVAAEGDIPTTRLEDEGAILENCRTKMDQIDAYTAWPSDFKRVVLCAMLLYKRRLRDTGLHEHVETLHALCWGKHIKAHNGVAFIHKDGAWRKYSGVVSEGLLYNLRSQLQALQGIFACLSEKGSTASTDAALLGDLSTIYNEIEQAHPGHVLQHLHTKAPHSVAAYPDDEADHLKRLGGHIGKMAVSLQKEVLHKTLYEYYGAWCSTPMNVTPGVCFTDTCVLFRGGGVEFVRKDPDLNVYLYVDLPFKDPVEAAASARLNTILGTTFWKNRPALLCTLSGLCLALAGKNIERAYMHFGCGGAGQSLVTAFIDALLPMLHAYIDMNIYFSDDEFRKQGELLVDKIVSTGQETVQGADRGFRLDLFKKHLSADPIAMRLLYSIITKMQELVGLKRYEMNRLPTFDGVDEAVFNSVMRRSLVIKHEARFIEAAALESIPDAKAKGIFAKDPSAKDFVRSGPAQICGWKLLHGHMRTYTQDECYSMIERYVDGDDGGLTRRCMRFACGLAIEGGSTPHEDGCDVPRPADPVASAIRALRSETNELIKLMLKNDWEYMTEYLTKHAACLTGKNHAARKERFHECVRNGLWKKTVKALRHTEERYVPMLDTRSGVEVLYPRDLVDQQQTYPEVLHRAALQEVWRGGSDRASNVEVRVSVLEDRIRDLDSKAPPRSRSVADLQKRRTLVAGIDKIKYGEQHAQRLLERLEGVGYDTVSNCIMVRNTYRTKYERRSRRSVTTVGLQGLPNVTQRIVAPGVDEFDVMAAQWTYLVQIVDKVGLLLNHPVAELTSMRQYLSHRDSVHALVHKDPVTAKSLCMEVLNGMKIPDNVTDPEFLTRLRLEGRLCRWLAVTLDPTFHSLLLSEGDKDWPEATCLFYLWTPVEDWVTDVMAKYAVARFRPCHLSLHYDAIKLSRGSYGEPADFCDGAQTEILTETGYNVTIVHKNKEFLEDMLLAVSVCCDEGLQRPRGFGVAGNCIPEACALLGHRTQEITTELRKKTAAHNVAAKETKGRSYRSCQEVCACVLHPVSDLTSIAAGSYLLHVEGAGRPHCIDLILPEDGQARFHDRNGALRTIPEDILYQSMSAALDSRTKMLFRVLPGGSPAYEGTDEKYLDLRAGTGKRSPRSRTRRCMKTARTMKAKPWHMKKGKFRMYSKIILGSKKTAAWKRVPYVRAGKKTVKNRSERERWSRKLEDFLTASDTRIVHLLRQDGIIKKKEKTKCPLCNKGVLRGLKFVKSAGALKHRCNRKGCQAYISPTHGHPVFGKLGRGVTASSSLNEQASVLFCIVAGATNVVAHRILDKNHKMIEDISRKLDAARRVVVERDQKRIMFGQLMTWNDVEGDEVDLGKEDVGAVDKKKPAQTMRWEQWQGLVERGDRRTLVLSKTNAKMTKRRAPGPGPLRKADWMPIANTYLKKRRVILHTDGAKSYRLKTSPVEGILHDWVVHKPKKVVKGKTSVWYKPKYVTLVKHNLPDGTTVMAKAGTQLIDRAWAFIRKHIGSRASHIGESSFRDRIRSAQWCYWNQGEDLWKATGDMLKSLP